MAVIRFSDEAWAKVHRHLFSRPGEHFAFFLAAFSNSMNKPVFIVKDAVCIPDTHTTVGNDGWTLTPQGFLPAINAAVRSGLALIEAHNHGGSMPRFSRTDRLGLEEFRAYIFDSLPGRPYAATVWGDSTIYGEFFREDGRTGPVRSITLAETQFKQIVSLDDDADPIEVTFDRQLPWFTQDGQRRLRRTRVGVVGAGGTGSHVVQQLAYLGVQDFVIVDQDVADHTSMNRLVTAAAADIGTPKSFLARRVIKSIAPTATVEAITLKLQTIEVLDALKGVDVLFGCVDNDGARLVLNELSRAYRIPYFDLAVGIDVAHSKVTSAGGRVVAVLPGGPCLLCSGDIDVDEARFFLSDEREQAFQIERGYVRGMHVAAPSVVSLNAAIAATAVNEFAIFCSGLRPANAYLDIDLLGAGQKIKGQRVGPRLISMGDACVHCSLAGAADDANLERFAQAIEALPAEP
jgi:molybdopterin/thiamine biosynthesis adenylyltransferase